MQEFGAAKIRRLRLAATLARYGTGLIFLVAFLATHSIGNGQYTIEASDKTLHLIGYMVLTISVLVSWELSIGILRPGHYFLVWLFGTIYGAFDEITQIPVGRTCSESDWLADIVGIVIGLTLFRVVRPLLYRWI